MISTTIQEAVMGTFDKDFIFGAATASYQIEGAVREDGRGVSIWDTFSHTPGKVVNADTGDVACDHYHRWEEDLDILAELGVDAYRFSIAWPRIQPNGSGRVNQAGIDFYSRLVDGLLARGITPFATLYHWDLPQALEDKGGWTARDTAYRFADYAEIMVRALGDRVGYWATLNEPWCVAMLGYVTGVHAPGRTSGVAGLTASHHLNLAHGLGVQALRSGTTSKVGIVLNYAQVAPADDTEQARQAAARVEAIANWIYSEPIMRGVYDPLTLEVTKGVSSWEFVEDGDLEIAHQSIDFVGHNYYSPTWVVGDNSPASTASPWVGVSGVSALPPKPPLTEMGWEIDPSGLTDLLVGFHARYPEVDLFVAENGAAMPDPVAEDGQIHDNDRIDYLKGHIGALEDAIARGVPLKGYLTWSLMDNFEWNLGYNKRFGIIRVDYPTQRRIWKDSARWYQSFLATRTL